MLTTFEASSLFEPSSVDVGLRLQRVFPLDNSYPEFQVSHMLTPLVAHVLQSATCHESTLKVTGFWYTSEVSTIVVSIEKI